jgi:outer membrane protein OmpA-like peptidoglycan-associated protein
LNPVIADLSGIRTHVIKIMMSILIMLAVNPHVLSAQEKKAVSLFEEADYNGVIDFYTRNYRQGLTGPDIRMLCQSMLRVGLVQDALELSQRSFLDRKNDPDVILAVCEALIYAGEYNTAYYLLEEYSDLKFDPEALYDVARRAAILKDWEQRQSDYDVTKLDGFNTEKNEFSLCIAEGKRIFCSSQMKDGPAKEEHFDKSHKDYTSIFEAEGDMTDHIPFNNGKFKGRFNVGPFEYTKDGFYFTYSAELGPGLSQLQIMKTDSKDPDAYKAEPVKLFAGNYNAAHPTFSPDGNRMIFSSDIPGGFGDMDLYYCIRLKDGWSSPINLGEAVNTKGNEVFPRLLDGQLYFSSNGHPGYGGLDIYVVTDDMHHEDLRNLYKPINTPFDDFGYFRVDEFSGYFSSNRPGGKGGDDIYRYEKIKVTPDPRMISGILEVKGIAQKNVKMVLLDAQGQIIEQAFTDQNGVFYFNRNPDGGIYQIRMDAEDEEVKNANLFLTDDQGRKSKKLVADEHGNFVFELLAVDDYFIEYLKVEDNTLFSFTLRAMVFRHEPGDMEQSIDVFLVTERGIVQKQEETDNRGYFSLKNVVPQERYFFNVEKDEGPMKIAILDNQNQIINILEMDANSRYFYDRPYEEGNFISLFNEDNELITVDKDAAIQLPDINYGYNKWELNELSREALEKLIGLLKNNEKLTIELSSHTDSRGPARYNEDLSKKRAHEAWAYIVSHGIDPRRIDAIGKGEDAPLNSCLDGVNCSEDEYSVNRRTEFKIQSN